MNQADFEETFEQARTIADIIRALARADMQTVGRPTASLFVFLADELDARFERIQVEIEAWDAPTAKPAPPPMPPLTEQEAAEEDEITEGLRKATVRLRKRNLNRAVSLARQAAEGQGPLRDHFAELGRRFGGDQEKPKSA